MWRSSGECFRTINDLGALNLNCFPNLRTTQQGLKQKIHHEYFRLNIDKSEFMNIKVFEVGLSKIKLTLIVMFKNINATFSYFLFLKFLNQITGMDF